MVEAPVAVDETGHAADDPLRGALCEGGRGTGGVGIGRAAHLVVVLEAHEHHALALGTEVHGVGDVDHDRDGARHGRGHAKDARVMAPDGDRQVDAGKRANAPRPAARGVDDDGRVDVALRGPHALDPAASRGDLRDLGVLPQARATVLCRADECAAREVGIGIPGIGLVRRDLVGDLEGRVEVPDAVRVEHAGVDADGAMRGAVGRHPLQAVGSLDPDEAGHPEAALVADELVPVAEPVLRRPGELRLGEEVVVDADETGAAAGGAGGERRSLHEGDACAARREVEGEARALDPRADDDDVRRVRHGLPSRVDAAWAPVSGLRPPASMRTLRA